MRDRAILDQIREMISGEGNTLPGVAELARRLDTSASAVRRALRTLSNQGMIILKQGARPVIRSPLSLPDSPAVDRLCAAIRSGISNGTYPVGLPLPKFLFLQKEYCVSPMTVSTTLRVLFNEGVIHKTGNRWIAGPRPADARDRGIGRRAQQPAILVLARDEGDMHSFYETSFKSGFSHPFNTEMTQYGIGMVFAQVQEQKLLKDLPSG